jgi:hypothetical protein
MVQVTIMLSPMTGCGHALRRSLNGANWTEASAGACVEG